MLTLIVFIGAAVFLAWFLIHNDRGAKEPRAALWEAFGFGAVSFVLALILETPLQPIDQAIRSGSVGLDKVFLFALAVGIIEEVCKFLPLAVFIRRKSYFNEYTDGIIYFALAGLSFSLLENLGYAGSYGGSTGIRRVVLLLFFHSATSGIVGYYFARAKLKPENYLYTGLALAGVAVLHGVYDFGLFSSLPVFVVLSLLLTLGLNTGLFLYYQQGVESDRAAGLSAVGSNRFCRHCGTANPRHMLYCEHCGVQA